MAENIVITFISLFYRAKSIRHFWRDARGSFYNML